MTDDDLTLMREGEGGRFGLYHPDTNAIQTYEDGEESWIPMESASDDWAEATKDELETSIEADIRDTWEQIAELRDGPLTAEQERELDQLESRLEAQERAAQINSEVFDNDDE